MSLQRYKQMDPLMLLGIINMKLRDAHPNLQDLLLSHELDGDILQTRLAQAGYSYDPGTNQFKPVNAGQADA